MTYNNLIRLMIITYQGENYFKIQSGSLVFLIDPTNSRSLRGAKAVINTLKPPVVSAAPDEDAPFFWIENQGEYEINGIPITSWSVENDGVEKTAYLIEMEDIKIAVLGHIAEEISPEALEHLKEVDVLILPAAGKPYLSEASAAKLVRQIKPKIVIPSLFKTEPVKFFKELNQNPKPEEKLVFKKKDLDLQSQAMKIVYLGSK